MDYVDYCMGLGYLSNYSLIAKRGPGPVIEIADIADNLPRVTCRALELGEDKLVSAEQPIRIKGNISSVSQALKGLRRVTHAQAAILGEHSDKVVIGTLSQSSEGQRGSFASPIDHRSHIPVLDLPDADPHLVGKDGPIIDRSEGP